MSKSNDPTKPTLSDPRGTATPSSVVKKPNPFPLGGAKPTGIPPPQRFSKSPEQTARDNEENARIRAARAGVGVKGGSK